MSRKTNFWNLLWKFTLETFIRSYVTYCFFYIFSILNLNFSARIYDEGIERFLVSLIFFFFTFWIFSWILLFWYSGALAHLKNVLHELFGENSIENHLSYKTLVTHKVTELKKEKKCFNSNANWQAWKFWNISKHYFYSKIYRNFKTQYIIR